MGMMDNPYYAPNPWAEAINGFRRGSNDARERGREREALDMRKQEAVALNALRELQTKQAQQNLDQEEALRRAVADRLPSIEAPATYAEGRGFMTHIDPGGPLSMQDKIEAVSKVDPKLGLTLGLTRENQLLDYDSKVQSNIRQDTAEMRTFEGLTGWPSSMRGTPAYLKAYYTHKNLVSPDRYYPTATTNGIEPFNASTGRFGSSGGFDTSRVLPNMESEATPSTSPFPKTHGPSILGGANSNPVQAKTETRYKPLPTADRNDIEKLVNIRRLLKEVKDSYAPSYTGPIQGRLGKLKGELVDLPEKQARFYSAIGNLQDTELRGRSGAQINEQEFKRMLGFLPGETKPDKNFNSRLDLAIGLADKMMLEYAKYYSGQGYKFDINTGVGAGEPNGFETKTVVERRVSPSGKRLVKYSDGTIGEE